ncbi:1,5-anhydro-D-fructose reductase, partial [Arthrobacter sp. Hiyo6]
MPALKWGLIGASDIAATRVIAAIRASGGETIGVFSGSADRAADFAAGNGLPDYTTDLDALLDWEIDAVYISSTNALHFEQAIRALKAGKHVLCEKPLALEAVQAEAWWSWPRPWVSCWPQTTTCQEALCTPKSANSSRPEPSAPSCPPKSPTPCSFPRGCADGGSAWAHPAAA